MANWSRPWGGTSVGDAGPYSDTQWAELYKVLMSGDESKRGVFVSTENDMLQVTEKSGAPDMSVDVSSGAVLVAGRAAWLDATNLAISAADPSLDRIDLVVARSDSSAQTVSLAVKTGTPAASPTRPSLDTTGSPNFEIPIAQVYVTAAASQINNSDITDLRSAVNIPLRTYIEVTNRSGQELVPGDVVVWDDSNSGSVTTTTTKDDYQVAGVVADIIPDTATGRLCVAGLMPVKVDTAVGIGNVLVTSTSAKQATNTGSNVIGRCLQSTAAAGTVLAALNVKPVYPAFSQKVVGPSPYYSLNSTSWVDIDSTNLSITVTTHGGDVDIWFSFQFYTDIPTEFIGVDVDVDGTRYTVLMGLAVGYGIVNLSTDGNANNIKLAAARVRLPGLAPGTHTFKLQWRDSASGGTVYIGSNSVVVFGVQEVIH